MFHSSPTFPPSTNSQNNTPIHAHYPGVGFCRIVSRPLVNSGYACSNGGWTCSQRPEVLNHSFLCGCFIFVVSVLKEGSLVRVLECLRGFNGAGVASERFIVQFSILRGYASGIATCFQIICTKLWNEISKLNS